MMGPGIAPPIIQRAMTGIAGFVGLRHGRKNKAQSILFEIIGRLGRALINQTIRKSDIQTSDLSPAILRQVLPSSSNYHFFTWRQSGKPDRKLVLLDRKMTATMIRFES